MSSIVMRLCCRLALPILGAVVAICPAATASAASTPLSFTGPTWSPDGSQVVFASTDTSHYRIETVPATGGGAVRTVYAGKTVNGCCDPLQWAASGRILFAANFTLTSIPQAGGAPIRVFPNTSRFIVSPNRRTIAFDDGCGCHYSRDPIGLVGVRGGNPLVIPKPANASDVLDGFSPDGKELVFNRYTYAKVASEDGPIVQTLMAEHVGGGAPVPLRRSGLIGASRVPAGADQVEWSPNGRWIAFVVGRKLELMPSAGGPGRVVETRPFSSYSWSPSSTALAYSLNSGRITTVDLRGHHAALWYDHSLKAFSESSADPPQWSPDGTRLVFMSLGGSSFGPAQIWIVGAHGQGPTRIA
jgi:Tol biopolymer transport system component